MIDLSRYVAGLNAKPVAVYGLGLSGMASVRALRAAGADVRAWDDDAEKRRVAEGHGAKIDPLDDLTGYAALILAPGIPLHFPQPHAVVLCARAAGVDIMGDVELLARSGHGLRTIGITGTNGKSTTTALVGHVLTQCGVKVAVGGNIGTAVLDLDLAGCAAIVIELSSYQLDLCPDFAPDIAVHINLTPDHIDRHGSIEGYVDAKMRIFRGPGDAVTGMDDAPSRSMHDRVVEAGQRRVYPVSVQSVLDGGVYVLDDILHDGEETFVLRDLPALRGVHNQQNAAMAYQVGRLMGLDEGAILRSFKTYPGLPHRMFKVRQIGNVAYINDSKATNADAAGKALACMDDIFWILGGKPKEGGLDGLDPFMGRIRQAFVIGSAADDFAAWLVDRNIPVHRSGTLDHAVRDAHDAAQAFGRGFVLLSPACASFDQFKSFEHRGDVFSSLVMALEGPA